MDSQTRLLDGARGVLHYSVSGHGPCVVLCHALGTDARLWSGVVAALSHSFQVITFDLRGHGQSPPALDEDYSFEAMATDVSQLLDHLDVGQVSLLGISVGGEIAQVFAARYPERISRLLLCSTACFTNPQRALLWEQRIAEIDSRGMRAIASAAVLRWFSQNFLKAHPDVVESMRERMSAIEPRVYAGIARTIQKMDLRAQIRGLRCPTLVVCGDEDGNTGPEVAATLVQNIHGAKLEVMPGVGHFPNLESPQQFERLLLEWLSS